MQVRLFPTKDDDGKYPVSSCERAIELLLLAGERVPLELCLRGLKHGDRAIRIASISALLCRDARATLSSIRSLLQDEDAYVQTVAAWMLTCWGESVPRELLINHLYAGSRVWIAEAFPPNWSDLFPLETALECVSSYRGRLKDALPGPAASEDSALFRRLAEGISPQMLSAFLRRDDYSGAYYGAWKLLKAQDKPLPLDILPNLLLHGPDVDWEAALLIGKHRMAAASDLLEDIWPITQWKNCAAITIALDDLGKADAVNVLLSEAQRGDSEVSAAIWGLGILGQRGRAIPREILHQSLRHPAPEARAQAIQALTSLNDISLVEALAAVNDSELPAVIAGFRACLALARMQIDIPTELLIGQLVELQEQKYDYHGHRYDGFTVRHGIMSFIYALDELQATIPLDTLLDAFSFWGEPVTPLITRYWRRHDSDIFAAMMDQAEAFLQQHL